MKAFFTQPIGQLARQNALGFIGCNLYLIVINFGSFDSIEAVDKIFNFAWGFTLLALIIAGYNLVEDQVPEYEEQHLCPSGLEERRKMRPQASKLTETL